MQTPTETVDMVSAVEVFDALYLNLGCALQLAKLIAESMETSPDAQAAMYVKVVSPLMEAVKFMKEANEPE